MERKLFAAGCFVLIALGLVHLLGHYGMATSAGDNETERQLLALMRDYRSDMGAGFVRSIMDILLGFSLAFSVLSIGIGLLGLVILRHASGSPGLVRAAATASAGIFGIMTAVGFRYWFPAPLAFLAAAFACFLGALFAGSRAGTSAPRP